MWPRFSQACPWSIFNLSQTISLIFHQGPRGLCTISTKSLKSSWAWWWLWEFFNGKNLLRNVTCRILVSKTEGGETCHLRWCWSQRWLNQNWKTADIHQFSQCCVYSPEKMHTWVLTKTKIQDCRREGKTTPMSSIMEATFCQQECLMKSGPQLFVLDKCCPLGEKYLRQESSFMSIGSSLHFRFLSVTWCFPILFSLFNSRFVK